jgi:hypothetical protein
LSSNYSEEEEKKQQTYPALMEGAAPTTKFDEAEGKDYSNEEWCKKDRFVEGSKFFVIKRSPSS